VETVLLIGGAHRLPGRSEPCKAELTCYFKSSRDFSQHACLSLPIDIGTGSATPYFASLGATGGPRLPLSKIVPSDANFLLYRGADLRGRSAGNNVPSSFCDPVKQVTAYYVCQKPIFMANADYQRFVLRAGKGLRGPPKPLTPVVTSRLLSLATRVKGIELTGPKPLGPGGIQEGPGIPTKALKCYRVDPARDVVKDRVYVGGKGPRTDFEKEIKPEKEDEGILPGDLQKWLAVLLGIIISVILGALLFVLIFSFVFRNYKEAQYLYESNPISAAAIAKAVAPKIL
jgi:hypothetical protein